MAIVKHGKTKRLYKLEGGNALEDRTESLPTFSQLFADAVIIMEKELQVMRHQVLRGQALEPQQARIFNQYFGNLVSVYKNQEELNQKIKKMTDAQLLETARKLVHAEGTTPTTPKKGMK